MGKSTEKFRAAWAEVFGNDDQQTVMAECQARFDEWLTSDEYRAIREQSRERWLKAGIDIDKVKDVEGRLRLLVARACRERLSDTFVEGSWFFEEPPSKWFPALFESACQQTADELQQLTGTKRLPKPPSRVKWTPEAESEGRRILKNAPDMNSNNFVSKIGGNREAAQSLYRFITGKEKRGTRND
jgi:hypothetical protein